MRFLSRLALVSAFCLPIFAHADTITKFSFTSTTQLNYPPTNPNPVLPITGYLIINTTTGVPLFSEIIVPAGTFDSSDVTTQVYNSDEIGIFFNYNRYYTQSLAIYLPTATLVNYAGGPICSTSIVCNGDISEYTLARYGNQFAAANLIPQGAVPEPSSLALLSTGVLAALGAVRRRIVGA